MIKKDDKWIRYVILLSHTGKKITEDEIKLEEFMSYLDIDRQLALKGGDYAAPEEPFKNLIAYVLHSHERRISDEQFEIYERFEVDKAL